MLKPLFLLLLSFHDVEPCLLSVKYLIITLDILVLHFPLHLLNVSNLDRPPQLQFSTYSDPPAIAER